MPDKPPSSDYPITLYDLAQAFKEMLDRMTECDRNTRETILRFEATNRKPIDPKQRLSDADAARIFALRGSLRFGAVHDGGEKNLVRDEILD